MKFVERDGVDLTAALFSESTARVLVSVGREDDVKFVGLCEARGVEVLRIGVTRLCRRTHDSRRCVVAVALMFVNSGVLRCPNYSARPRLGTV
jgi:hypothetical protein